MAPIHSVRERRHPSVYSPVYSVNVRAHHKLKGRWGEEEGGHSHPLSATVVGGRRGRGCIEEGEENSSVMLCAKRRKPRPLTASKNEK